MLIKPKLLYSFDAIAEIYDSTRAFPQGVQLGIQEFFVNFLRRSELVLEIGAGTGRISSLLHQIGAEVFCLDVSSRMLSVLEAKMPGRAVCGDAHCLPFMDKCFSSVLMSDAFHLFSDQQKALHECTRVTRDHLFMLNQRIVFKELASIDSEPIDFLKEYSLKSLDFGVEFQRPFGLSATELGAVIPTIKRIKLPIYYDSVSWNEAICALESKTFTPQWTIPHDVHSAIMKNLRREFYLGRVERGWQCEILVWKIAEIERSIELGSILLNTN